MNCYIASQDRNYDLPDFLHKDNTLFYPESWMTTEQLLNTGRPRNFHIVTDSHFLVPLYKSEEVFIYQNGHWINPEMETYGTSYNIILSRFWKSKLTIPRAVYDGQITNVMGHGIEKNENYEN